MIGAGGLASRWARDCGNGSAEGVLGYRRMCVGVRLIMGSSRSWNCVMREKRSVRRCLVSLGTYAISGLLDFLPDSVKGQMHYVVRLGKYGK
jgi:hypothetical protein